MDSATQTDILNSRQQFIVCTLAHHCEIDRLSSVWPALHDTVCMEIESMRNASSIAFCVLLMNEFHLFTTLTALILCELGKLKIFKESVVRVHWVWKTLFANDTINEPYLIKALLHFAANQTERGRTMVEASSSNDQNRENKFNERHWHILVLNYTSDWENFTSALFQTLRDCPKSYRLLSGSGMSARHGFDEFQNIRRKSEFSLVIVSNSAKTDIND